MSAATGADTGTTDVLLLSDIHFDSTADPALVPALARAPAGQWSAIFAHSTRASFPKFRDDTNWPLLQSALSAMHGTDPPPKFILISGDLLAHDLATKFQAALPGAKEREARFFIRKTLQFVAAQLQTTFPNIPLLSTLGNNDNSGADYALVPGGRFLKDTGQVVETLAAHTEDHHFKTSWRSLGNFSAHVVSLPGYRVLVLNTNFWSAKYTAPSGPDPGDRVLEWLGTQLDEAQSHREKVWLLFHIPPGVDGYATDHGCSSAAACDTVVTMWKRRYQQRFEELLAVHSRTVTASFAGHSHMDEFRLLPGNQFVLMTPAITPSNGENPAFRRLSIANDGSLLNLNTYYLDLAKAWNDPSASWRLEYNFQTAWAARGIDAESLTQIYRNALADPQATGQWLAFYSVQRQSLPSGPGSAMPHAVRASLCAVGTVRPDAFLQCYGAR